MSELPVLFEELAAAGGKKIGIATLNAEKSLNSLNLQMIDLLQARFTAWEQDDAIACVFLQGSGDKAFCAGGDVVALHGGSAAYGEQVPNDYCLEFFTREYALDYHMQTYKKPLIVWGHGIVMGGGLGLMDAGGHRVATETNRMAMPEVTIGLYPDVGGTWFLNHAPGSTGLFLGLTGANINAADAKFVGLADRLVAQQYKQAVLNDLVASDWSGDADVVVAKILRGYEAQSVDKMPAGNVQANYELINQLCDADSTAEICQQLLDYQSDDKWLNRAIDTLRNGCPVTPHLVVAQMKHGEHLGLADVFRMELVMSRHCAAKGHFKEGVRALLIDKDRQPNWQHKSIDEVSQAEVEAFFVPFDDDPLANL
ncbi:MAG: enoyl-CoA hydratase/isomerase family protein [Cellvibrionaceae bacterium]|nr:enoyl-CoA hydratase/isomerase family protein [Cellvibrionaceae bacterium]MCV6626365.1 enoyl-CoA hydratase/isomerase family protein [Cellvibrionaceae bacterium]